MCISNSQPPSIKKPKKIRNHAPVELCFDSFLNSAENIGIIQPEVIDSIVGYCVAVFD